MFKVVIKTTDKTGIVRADVVSYKSMATVYYTVNSAAGIYYSTTSTQPKPIKDYIVTLFTRDSKTIKIRINQEKDLTEFIDKLILAEEEQMTTSSVSMEELYEYAAEKILGNKHDAFPGIKLSVIEVNGTFYDDIDTAPNDPRGVNISSGGSSSYGFGM